MNRRGAANQGGEALFRDSFATVSSVVVDDPLTWDGRVFLTLDIDWASDDVLSHSIDLVQRLDIPATWYATHATPILDRIRKDPRQELGIHPNFLPLLMNGDTSLGKGAAAVIRRLLEIVPDAQSVRTHSLVQSSRLLDLYSELGLTHESSCFIPEQSGIELKPWIDWSGIKRVPYFWQDNFWFESKRRSSVDDLHSRSGIRGYDFHPIHLFLNTESIDRYDAARVDFANTERLRQRRFPGEGSCTFFLNLLARLEGVG